jgi:hypothetical protein
MWSTDRRTYMEPVTRDVTSIMEGKVGCIRFVFCANKFKDRSTHRYILHGERTWGMTVTISAVHET